MKHTRVISMLVVVFAAAVLMGRLAFADAELPVRGLVSSGGSVVSESSFTLHTAVGQPAAGVAANGLLLCSGYLCQKGVFADGREHRYSMYLPSVVR